MILFGQATDGAAVADDIGEAASTVTAPLTNAAGAVGEAGSNMGARVTDILGFLGPAAPYISALLVFLIGKFIAGLIGKGVSKALGKTSMDEKLSKMAGMKPGGLGAGLGKGVYYVLLLFILILALDIAGMKSAVEPLQNLLGKFLDYIPNLISGGILLFIFVFLAKLVKNIVAGLMRTGQVDSRLGITEGEPVTAGVSNGLFGFVLLMLLPTAMAAFKMPAISEPLLKITNSFTAAIPGLIGGGVLLAVGYLIAKIVRDIVVNGLNAAGFNNLPAKMGYTGNLGTGAKSPAGIVGLLVLISIMVTIATQALGMMNLGTFSEIGDTFLSGWGRFLMAILIIGVAFFLSNIAYSAIAKTGNMTLAKIAKYGILGFAGFAALERSGIAPSITGTPFTALVIAAAVALGVGGAIAIGLGGREAAARYLNKLG